MINIELLKSSLPALLSGALVSLQIAGISLVIGLSLGTLLGILQTEKPRTFLRKLLSYLVTFYVTVIRGTPMLIQINFWYWAIVPALGLGWSAFTTAAIAIGLNSAAYISQVIRSGIASVSTGQQEAAYSLGLTRWDTLRFIILPQAIRMVLPALANEGVTLIKDSSLAYSIGVMELFQEGKVIIDRTYEVFTVYIGLAIIYLIITTSLSLLVDYLEKHLKKQ